VKIKSIVIFSLFLGAHSNAIAPEAQRILNRQNRRIDSPPQGLKANNAALDYRYAAGVERTQSAVNESSAPIETVPVQSVYDGQTIPQSKMAPRDERGLGQYLGDRNLGIGFISAGAYGVFGTEVDLAIDRHWSAGLGIGTGMTYRTWGFHSRYLFRPSSLTGFVEAGYTNWYLHKASITGEAVYPQHMAQRFLSDSSGKYVSGARAHLVYPGFGILYKHRSGMGAIAQIQYFINTSGGLQGALGGSAGLYLYF